MQQVRDDEHNVEDYDFLDRLVHGGSSNNGNNGLANVGAYLAIHEEEGELKVEKDLVTALDEKQAQTNRGGRNRFSNIVYDATTEKRENNTLYDKGVDGHEVLEELIDEFESESEYDSLPSDNEILFKDQGLKQSSNSSNGGDNLMTEAPEYVEETYDLLDDLEDAVNRKDAATAERRAEEVKSHVEEMYGDLEEVEEAFQQYDDSMREHLDNFTTRLDNYLGELDQMNQQAHNAARDLMETERMLLDYELDDRTEELIDIAEEL